jgi:hypothetical protein
MTSTRTFVVLGISKTAYEEIAKKLRNAGYEHVFSNGVMDMHGLALKVEPEKPGRSPQGGSREHSNETEGDESTHERAAEEGRRH